MHFSRSAIANPTMSMKYLAFSLLLALRLSSVYAEESVHIDLKNPVMSKGVLSTEHGGIVWNEQIRIQAKKIRYIDGAKNKKKIQRIIAEGDVVLTKGGYLFCADKLLYDFFTQTGQLTNARAGHNPWFFSSQTVLIEQDGSFKLEKAIVTTSENLNEKTFKATASEVTLSKENEMKAQKVAFSLGPLPFFYLPAFSAHLSFFQDPPLQYKASWDRGIGPRLSLRYRFFSTKETDLFFRLDYRAAKGFGGAFETNTSSEDHLFIAKTQSYIAKDKNFVDENNRIHYRLKGDLFKQSQDHSGKFILSYDKLSEETMASDFNSGDFEVLPRSVSFAKAEKNWQEAGISLRVMPRLNNFQTLKQELPATTLFLNPAAIGSSGIIHEQRLRASYLDYIVAKQLSQQLPSFQSGRFEYLGTLYRPFHLGSFTFVPRSSLKGLIYTQDLESKALATGALHYGASLQTEVFGYFTNGTKHLFQPYAQFDGIITPFAKKSVQPIFSLNDALARQENLRLGMKNSFFFPQQRKAVLDLYSVALFQQTSYKNRFPRAMADLELGFQRASLLSNTVWNLEKKELERASMQAKFTATDLIALGIEYRYRSALAARRCDPNNSILDLSTSLEDLLLSPLSDRRDTLCAKAAFELSARTFFTVEEVYGFGRQNEKNYNLFKAEFSRYLSSHWLLRCIYEQGPDTMRVAFALKLTN